VVTIKSQVDGPLLAAGFIKADCWQAICSSTSILRRSAVPHNRKHRSRKTAGKRAGRCRPRESCWPTALPAQQRDQLVATAKALAATIEADQAAVDRAKLNLGYTTISSPINGKTGPYIVFPGNQVHANDQQGMITITEIQPVKITFNLPQGDLPQVQDRMLEGKLVAGVMARSDIAAVVATAADYDKEIPVKVDFIGNRSTTERARLNCVRRSIIQICGLGRANSSMSA
jgi:hypothetical protein